MDLYKQCRDKTTTAQQRTCFPAAVQQSEIELAAAEQDTRADLEELEAVSQGSRALRPVQAFDEAARAFRAFREAERQRVLTSYGSGNGGGLAAAETVIRMNLERADALAEEASTR
ncbi:lysozyme inhibitor LprI family protein [Ralstonia pseudosolanacearum]|uniref:lysozyme inhibitor LprI family protein n=1 Tax=Ralstonia pseudosolanacearum TaxID=1310165 RepID=UPI002006AF36|nr:lysozyme inhibitor LprI family protein [Ralstonia pseudosolanacearum]